MSVRKWRYYGKQCCGWAESFADPKPVGVRAPIRVLHVGLRGYLSAQDVEN